MKRHNNRVFATSIGEQAAIYSSLEFYRTLGSDVYDKGEPFVGDHEQIDSIQRRVAPNIAICKGKGAEKSNLQYERLIFESENNTLIIGALALAARRHKCPVFKAFCHTLVHEFRSGPVPQSA